MKKFILTAFILLAGCTAQVIDKNAQSQEEASLIPLTRVFQRVIRFDCAGNVQSDQIETTQSPTATIKISPVSRKDIYSSDFENLTLNTQASCIVDHSEFNLDYSYGACNMRVASGTNQIRYRFYYCPQWATKYDSQGKAYQACVGTLELREEGITWVRVTYEEINKTETLEYHPSAESCRQHR